jgi:hypothetical protein
MDEQTRAALNQSLKRFEQLQHDLSLLDKDYIDTLRFSEDAPVIISSGFFGERFLPSPHLSSVTLREVLRTVELEDTLASSNLYHKLKACLAAQHDTTGKKRKGTTFIEYCNKRCSSSWFIMKRALKTTPSAGPLGEKDVTLMGLVANSSFQEVRSKSTKRASLVASASTSNNNSNNTNHKRLEQQVVEIAQSPDVAVEPNWDDVNTRVFGDYAYTDTPVALWTIEDDFDSASSVWTARQSARYHSAQPTDFVSSLLDTTSHATVGEPVSTHVLVPAAVDDIPEAAAAAAAASTKPTRKRKRVPQVVQQSGNDDDDDDTHNDIDDDEEVGGGGGGDEAASTKVRKHRDDDDDEFVLRRRGRTKSNAPRKKPKTPTSSLTTTTTASHESTSDTKRALDIARSRFAMGDSLEEFLMSQLDEAGLIDDPHLSVQTRKLDDYNGKGRVMGWVITPVQVIPLCGRLIVDDTVEFAYTSTGHVYVRLTASALTNRRDVLGLRVGSTNERNMLSKTEMLQHETIRPYESALVCNMDIVALVTMPTPPDIRAKPTERRYIFLSYSTPKMWAAVVSSKSVARPPLRLFWAALDHAAGQECQVVDPQTHRTSTICFMNQETLPVEYPVRPFSQWFSPPLCGDLLADVIKKYDFFSGYLKEAYAIEGSFGPLTALDRGFLHALNCEHAAGLYQSWQRPRRLLEQLPFCHVTRPSRQAGLLQSAWLVWSDAKSNTALASTLARLQTTMENRLHVIPCDTELDSLLSHRFSVNYTASPQENKRVIKIQVWARVCRWALLQFTHLSLVPRAGISAGFTRTMKTRGLMSMIYAFHWAASRELPAPPRKTRKQQPTLASSSLQSEPPSLKALFAKCDAKQNNVSGEAELYVYALFVTLLRGYRNRFYKKRVLERMRMHFETIYCRQLLLLAPQHRCAEFSGADTRARTQFMLLLQNEIKAYFLDLENDMDPFFDPAKMGMALASYWVSGLAWENSSKVDSTISTKQQTLPPFGFVTVDEKSFQPYVAGMSTFDGMVRQALMSVSSYETPASLQGPGTSTTASSGQA